MNIARNVWARSAACCLAMAALLLAGVISTVGPAQALGGEPVVLWPGYGQTVEYGTTGPLKIDFSSADQDTYEIVVECDNEMGYSWAAEYEYTGQPQPWTANLDPLVVPADFDCYVHVIGSDYYSWVPFQVDLPPVRVTYVTASPETFYPRVHDGYRDTTSIGYSLSRAADITIAVTNANDTTVLTDQLGRIGQGRRAWTWDGRNASGALVADGGYTVVVRAIDPRGHQASSSVHVSVTHGTKIVSKTVGKYGDTGAVSLSRYCYARYPDPGLKLYCRGGRLATATYPFRVPASAYDISLVVNGHYAAGDEPCCGVIGWRWTRPSLQMVRVRVKVTGYRAAVFNSIVLKYRYRQPV
jgi:hypothetical protein